MSMMLFPGGKRGRAGAAWPILIWVLAAGAALVESQAVPGRGEIEETIEGLSRGRSLGEVAVSPDGKRVAWSEGMRGEEELHVAPLENLGKAERVTAARGPAGRCRDTELVWAPDSRAVAFFSDCADPGGQADLYLSRLDGNAPRRLTTLRGFVDEPSFSPDGTRIGFLYVPGATRPAGALAAMKPWSGVIGEEGLEIQRVAVVAISGAAPAAPVLATPEN